MVRRRVAPAAAALAAALLVLAACSNPIDFNAEVEDKVMTAKDMYLEVVAVTPAQGEGEADPSSPIVFRFDRTLNADTIETAIAAVGLSKGGTAVSDPWTSSFYNETTKELYLYHTVLDGEATYTASLGSDTMLSGSDGSALRDTISWSFTTKEMPGGNLSINSGATYTTSTSVTLGMTYNPFANNIRFSNTAFAKDDILPSWHGSPPSSFAWTLSSGDAIKSVYYQFAGASDKSSVFHAEIILDTTPPAPPTITTSTTSVPTWISGGGGIGRYRYRADSGTPYTDRTSTSYTYLLSTGAHTIYVAERDAAGNYSSDASASFTAAISPLSGSTLISTSPTLYWSDNQTVTLYLGVVPIGQKTPVYEQIASGITTENFIFTEALVTRTTYYWYYTYTILTRTYTKGPFRFTTIAF